jgi:hypothetical protein
VSASNVVELSSYRAKRHGESQANPPQAREVVFTPYVAPMYPVIVWVPFWYPVAALAPVPPHED